MINFCERNDIITVESKAGKDICFINPYISRKGFLTFKDTSIEGVDAEYDYLAKVLILSTKTKKFNLKISQDKIDWLDKFYQDEYEKVNKYYSKSVSNNVELIITDTGVDTKEILESGYNPYYVKVFEFATNKYLGTKDLDYNDLSKHILANIDISKYPLVEDDSWEYRIVPLTDIKK